MVTSVHNNHQYDETGQRPAMVRMMRRIRSIGKEAEDIIRDEGTPRVKAPTCLPIWNEPALLDQNHLRPENRRLRETPAGTPRARRVPDLSLHSPAVVVIQQQQYYTKRVAEEYGAIHKRNWNKYGTMTVEELWDEWETYEIKGEDFYMHKDEKQCIDLIPVFAEQGTRAAAVLAATISISMKQNKWPVNPRQDPIETLQAFFRQRTYAETVWSYRTETQWGIRFFFEIRDEDRNRNDSNPICRGSPITARSACSYQPPITTHYPAPKALG